jgi:glycogen debranching enzyme
MNPSPHVQADFDESARAILRGNDRGGYTVPRAGLYPFQWNWDSAFVALGFATFDMDRAWTELETLFAGQWANGMVPHIIFHKDDDGYFPGPDIWASGTQPRTSGITQPPVAASVARRLWEQEGRDPHHARMRALFPKLLGWHRWFHTYRDPMGNGLVMATHNWETGRDNNSEWDAALARVDASNVRPYRRRDTSHVDPAFRPTQSEYDRYVALIEFGRARDWNAARITAENPFRMIDVGMSMILIRANRDLLALAEAFGEGEAAAELRARVALSEKGVHWLWDENHGVHCSRDLVDGRSSDCVTSASFLAFYAGVGDSPQRAQMIGRLKALADSGHYMVASLAPGSRTYDPVRYWRGPVWLVVNSLIARGLEESGETTLAKRIRDDGRALIEKSGFCEYFSPETGQGCGGDNFSWTAAIWLDELRTS